VAVPCPLGCLSCYSAVLCIECQAGYFLSPNNLCLSSCPERYYQSSQSALCLGCAYDCLTCSDSNSCLSCSSTVDFRVLENATSRCLPKEGHF
jgi:proprotein convertase subtilisin/kexin type 5